MLGERGGSVDIPGLAFGYVEKRATARTTDLLIFNVAGLVLGEIYETPSRHVVLACNVVASLHAVVGRSAHDIDDYLICRAGHLSCFWFWLENFSRSFHKRWRWSQDDHVVW